MSGGRYEVQLMLDGCVGVGVNLRTKEAASTAIYHKSPNKGTIVSSRTMSLSQFRLGMMLFVPDVTIFITRSLS